VDFIETVGSTVLHHDFHSPNGFLEPFWTDEMPAGGLHVGGFPHEAVVNVKNFALVDDVSIVNPDGSETPLMRLDARLDAHITWQNAPSSIDLVGITPFFPPNGAGPQPFMAHLFPDRAIANIRATAINADGSVMKTFQVNGLHSRDGFDTVFNPAPPLTAIGFESLGIFVP